MKTAKEMFEEWFNEHGYKGIMDIQTDHEGILYYIEGDMGINFDNKLKQVDITDIDFMDLKLLQAINKQVEELGWLDVKDKR